MTDEKLRTKVVTQPGDGSDGHAALSLAYQPTSVAPVVDDTNPVRSLEPSAGEQEQADMRVGFRQAALQGFFDNRMERDKALLTLCTAGVGAVLTLWTAKTVHSRWEFAIGLGAAISFLAGIGMVLSVFQLNATYIERMIKGENFDAPHGRLERLDRWTPIAFLLGLLLLVLGVSIAVFPAHTGPLAPDSQQMSTVKKNSTIKTGADSSSPAPGAVSPTQGVGKPAPGRGVDTGSLKNLHQLAPKPAANVPNKQPVTSAPPKSDVKKKP